MQKDRALLPQGLRGSVTRQPSYLLSAVRIFNAALCLGFVLSHRDIQEIGKVNV